MKKYLNTPEKVIKALKEGKEVKTDANYRYKMIDGVICYLFDKGWSIGAVIVDDEKPYIEEAEPLKLEVGKTYIAKDGSEVKIIYKSPIRGNGFLGIRATDGMTHPDDAIWYNPNGSHYEKYDDFTIIKPK